MAIGITIIVIILFAAILFLAIYVMKPYMIASRFQFPEIGYFQGTDSKQDVPDWV